MPSGHATAAATFAVLAIYVVGRGHAGRGWRRALQALAAVGALSVGWARIVLDAHWPADIAVGFALGGACAAAAAWWDAAHPPSATNRSAGEVAMRPHTLWMAVVALLPGACSQSSSPSAKPLVVASFYPLYEFTREVAGPAAEVVSLVPPGVEPHDWEPSPPDLTRIQKARLVVYNGADFEPWMDKLLATVAGPRPVVVNTTERVEPIVADLPGHRDAGGRSAVDPHVWLDPLLAQDQVEAIRAGLATIDPPNAGGYAERARAYTNWLAALHAAFEGGLSQCARRDVVVSHAAFGYLARRYRLVQVPLMGLAPEAEPSPAALAALVRLARRQKVTYIFFESLVSPKLAETLAREVGARTLVLNPIEGLTPEERAQGKTYVSLMRDNLDNLRLALECR